MACGGPVTSVLGRLVGEAGTTGDGVMAPRAPRPAGQLPDRDVTARSRGGRGAPPRGDRRGPGRSARPATILRPRIARVASQPVVAKVRRLCMTQPPA